MADLGEILGILSQARRQAEDGQQLLATAHEHLADSAQQLTAMGVVDRATIIQTAAQGAQQAISALAQAVQIVQEAIAATQQATGGG